MTTSKLTRAAGAAALACACLAAAPASAGPTVITQYGKITGKVAEGMKEFLGIRYAAPPVGALRWQPPQPVPANLFTKDATNFGPHCAQPASPYGIASNSEDCLYLNVYVPDKRRAQNAKPLPVMFWIHGGALLVGESDDYDPVGLVTNNDVIVVTTNYRLGYLGFLATSGLDAEGHLLGNYGLQDQQFALDYVRTNIAAFGGDPSRVTMFGQSAGGLSTLSNLVSPTASGLFSRAIIESGAYVTGLQFPSVSQAETTGAAIAQALGCSPTDTACLRAASVSSIVTLDGAAGLSLTPIVDGTTLPLSPGPALQTGKFNRVPLMNGAAHDEYRQFLTADADLTAQEYPGALAGIYGQTLGAAIAAEYPVGRYAKPVLALAAVITDQTFACQARLIDRLASHYVPVYGYEFNDRHAPQDFLPPAGYPYGAYHASEIQFLFDIPKLPGTRPLDGAEMHLSDVMQKYWTNFTRDASPDGRGVPAWSAYAKGSDILESLLPATPVPESDFSHVHHCAFWAPIDQP